MQLHPNAKTTPRSRLEVVQRLLEGQRAPEIAQAMGISERTVYKWQRRYREEGVVGLEDRRSAPRRVRGTAEKRVQRICALRRRRRTGADIALRLGMPRSTVHAVLRRCGLARLRDLDPKPPARRYVRERPGELVHLDIKTLGRIRRPGHRVHGDRSVRSRGAGWEYAHVAIDDASRLAYVEVLPDQRSESAMAFLGRALAWFRRRRISVERIMTDNGSCYVSHDFAAFLEARGIRHLRTRPYRPQTNGKAERFIGTLVRGWAYGRTFSTSGQRAKALPKWLRYYNDRRPHRSLDDLTPTRFAQRAS